MEQAVAKSTFIVPYRIVWGWQGVRRVSERVQLLANNPPQQLSRGFSDDSEDVPDTVSTARLGLSSPTRFFVRFTWFMTGGAPLPAIIFCACSPAVSFLLSCDLHQAMKCESVREWIHPTLLLPMRSPVWDDDPRQTNCCCGLVKRVRAMPYLETELYLHNVRINAAFDELNQETSKVEFQVLKMQHYCPTRTQKSAMYPLI